MLKGAFTALVTPFTEGVLDEKAFTRLVARQIDGGVQGLVPCGTTGESATLAHEEHNRVIDLTIEAAAGRVPVIAGTGSNSTAETIRLTRHAEDAGAQAALLITPYYNKPSQAGLLAHYRAVSEAVSIPLVLYNVPGRTGVNMSPDTVARLSEFTNIIGIKEASGDLAQVSRVIELCIDDFYVLSGDDFTTLPLLSLGGCGVISVTSNIVPADVSSMVGRFISGDVDGARVLHYKLSPLNRAMFLETNPVPAKTALAMLGLMEEELRLPLARLSAANRETLLHVLKCYGLAVKGI
ncbi:MAG: 4-hydroxy-tetrahydrodipicolinate synthase [Thermodesulfobacteriota bacterium]